MSDWTDAIVGDRMVVDREFSDRVSNSKFSNQEWGLIMTATDLEIEHADDPDRAQIVANTENLSQIMPELEEVRNQMPSMGGEKGGGSGGSGSGIVDQVKGALGLGNGQAKRQERTRAAEKLTQEYATELQRHLESKGKWDQVRVAYQE